MSVSDSASAGKLASRAVRVRNRCLAALAARRSLPVPSAEELTALGDGLGLRAAWEQWETSHTPPTRVVEIGAVPTAAKVRARWRSPRLMKTAAVVAAGMLGVVVGGLWRQRVGAQANAAAAEVRWLAVNDSVTQSLNARLIETVLRDPRSPVSLSAADLAALIFRSPRRRTVAIDSLEARIDSLLWIRGRLRRGPRFELGGDVRVLRRGIAELRVRRLAIDGTATDSTMVSRLVAGPRPRSVDVDRLRFDVPGFVSSILIADGAAGAVPLAGRR